MRAALTVVVVVIVMAAGALMALAANVGLAWFIGLSKSGAMLLGAVIAVVALIILGNSKEGP